MSTFLDIWMLSLAGGALGGLVCLFKFYPPYKGPDLIKRDGDVVWFRYQRLWRTSEYRCAGRYDIRHLRSGVEADCLAGFYLRAAYERQQWEENRP